MSISKITPSETETPAAHTQSPEKSFSEGLLDMIVKVKPYIVTLMKNWKKLVIVNLVVLILALIYLFLIAKPYFKSTITILPNYGNKASDMLGQFSGLAAIAGVDVGKSDPTQIYQNLIISESILSEVIYSKYQTKEFPKPVNLIEYFELDPDKDLPKELQQRKMFLKLFEQFEKKKISLNYDRLTKILDVSVEMPESKLASDVANNLVYALDKYVRTKRKSNASEQKQYLDLRINQVKDTLGQFEEKLKNFREQNRVVIQSPELQLEQARLMRNVEIQQTVYGELRKQLELIKLEEIKDAPIVNVKEFAQEPILKEGPKRAITLIVILFFSFVFSSVYVIFRNDIKVYVKKVKEA